LSSVRTTSERSAAEQVQSWEIGKAGEAVRISVGRDDSSLVTLTSAGTLQWWDTAMLKVPLHTYL